eukprot:gene10284-11345_t
MKEYADRKFRAVSSELSIGDTVLKIPENNQYFMDYDYDNDGDLDLDYDGNDGNIQRQEEEHIPQRYPLRERRPERFQNFGSKDKEKLTFPEDFDDSAETPVHPTQVDLYGMFEKERRTEPVEVNYEGGFLEEVRNLTGKRSRCPPERYQVIFIC